MSVADGLADPACDSEDGDDLKNPAAAVAPATVIDAAERAVPVNTLEVL